MKNANRFLLLALASMMFVGLCFVYPSVSQAGCPTNIAPTTGFPWAEDSMDVTISGTNCVYRVYFCRRPVGPVLQFYIKSLKRVSGNCDSVKWAVAIGQIQTDLMKTGNAVPCDQHIMTVVSVFSGQCVQFNYNNGNPICLFCSDAYCQKQCDLCLSGGVPVLQNCTTTLIGSATCEIVSGIEDVTWGATAEEGNEWTGTCYYLGCVGD